MALIATDNARLVVGLGQTGLSIARYFARCGLPFAMADNRLSPPGASSFEKAFPEVQVHLGPFDSDLFSSVSELVLSPGIPLSEPAIVAAREAGVTISGDIHYFSKDATAPIVAITGSNGKSTVTTLVGEMAKDASVAVAVGGNLGTPALDLLDPGVALYVMELSSFQLERCDHLGAEVATVLNVSEDHLDHHGSMVAYHQAKHRIFRGCHKVVVNRDEPLSSPLVPDEVERWEYRLGRSDFRCFGLLEQDGQEYIALAGKPLLATNQLLIAGRHNLSNALAALALGSAAGLPLEAMLATLTRFRGLAHRCEFVADIAGVGYYNDSKGTNVGASEAAIQGLAGEGKVVLIAGGLGKGASFSALGATLAKYGRGAVLIGEAADDIDRAIAGRVTTAHAATMAEAVRMAAKISAPGDRVLLSPACASFDMFDGYEHRGRMFVEAVTQLSEEGGDE
ncbi:UDP-N-acetylmuramoyl-L-alanine--D-glutamate ligase [Spongiibacter taiwanensis]|uniref:UDP-N-acetylmuramoyl-L-alanine--D-glutamate ligase n=1 Tax=Spongiibacter taiwanensis TaxID=1748242 RepID=UPI002034F64A|nr:UDP-N-acetylmuramoyl-L-alanine--D-glutamate ligase [Spongiibacter taiwanensis]USA44277.1 UDP-N-acetylmuramoyl-L-alanine--D-glutamate ligase [Spongiibacter taiwanensis]